MRHFWSLSLLCAVLLFQASCTADVLPEPIALPCDGETPTYSAGVQQIIEKSCAYSGCHLGGAPGVYDSYSGLLPHLQSGQFRNRVINARDNPTLGMPPNYAPDNRDRDLSEEELALITCWLDAGYPQE